MSRRGKQWVWAVLYVALLAGVTAYFFSLGELEKADQTGSVIGAYTALIGIPPVLAAVWELWHRPSTPPSLEEAAGQLAEAIRKQWDDEAKVRRVNDPRPLPVAWQAADEELAEPWLSLTDLAHAWPGGTPGDPDLWPQDAAGLADEGAQIGEVFTDRVPTRRLVILGEPGAGKSVLLMRLLQDLLARRTNDNPGPVPVIFSLASWNPGQPLTAWMADQLRRTHRGLRRPAQATTMADAPGDLAGALVEGRRILPLLDGFDELPPNLHRRALDTLNRELPARQPIVLAARAAAYRDVLRGPGTTVRLNGAAAIQLLPLNPGKAAAYLRRDAGGPHTTAAARWDAVAAELGTDSPVGQALSTPLGLFLARAIYNPRPGNEPFAAAPHPDELRDLAAFPDRAAIDRHLFNAFIPAAYAPDAHHPPRWNAEQAHRTLVTLAHFLERDRNGSPDLAWWEIRQAIPTYIYVLLFGLTGGLLYGLLAGLAVRSVGLLTLGLAVGLALGLLSGSSARDIAAPATGLHWSPGPGFPAGLVFGLLAGLEFGLTAGLTTGLAGGLTLGLIAGLDSKEPDLTAGIGPDALFHSDRKTFVTLGLVGGLVGGLVFGLLAGLEFGLTAGLTTGLAGGLAGGLTLGLVADPASSVWPYFVVARAYLAARRQAPWTLMSFLQDAHEHRGVLRQVGSVYQFRHIDLQRHLAQQHHSVATHT